MKRSKILIAMIIVAAVMLLGFGCGFSGEAQSEKLKVVTTLFPQYDFIREIGKDKVDVVLLLPPGMEAHSFEPSPRDIVRIRKSDVFVYTGEFMEPWAHKVIKNVKRKNLVVVDAGKGIDLMEEADHHEHEDGKEPAAGKAEAEEHDHHHHGGKDPHIWLDPVYAQKMVANIVAGLSKADPKNMSYYRKNGEIYRQKLEALHRKFLEAFKHTKSKQIIYGGHFAFGYFAKRYGLEHLSPYNGFAPDAEPTPQRVAELVKNMKKSGQKVIYYEELIDPKVAKVISAQTGAKMLLLHGAHNVTKTELKAGISYIRIMEDNLEKLKQGLGRK
jgi:zinc transport system substrate-binding protein